MNREEFRRWCEDIMARMPATGEWMKTLSDATIDVWLNDVFSDISLEHALEANKRLMREGMEAYKREFLPSIVSKYVSEIAWAQREMERKDQQRRDEARYRAADKQRNRRNSEDRLSVAGTMTSIGCAAAFRAVCDARRSNPEISSHEIEAIIEQHLENVS